MTSTENCHQMAYFHLQVQIGLGSCFLFVIGHYFGHYTMFIIIIIFCVYYLVFLFFFFVLFNYVLCLHCGLWLVNWWQEDVCWFVWVAGRAVHANDYPYSRINKPTQPFKNIFKNRFFNRKKSSHYHYIYISFTHS